MSSLPSYTVYFRGHPCCKCQQTWLPALEAEAQRRGLIKGQLPISQLIGGDPRSGGTHVDGGESDFWPLTGITQVDGDGGFVWLCRQMGADPTWHRPFNWDHRNGVEHVHSGLVGCPHNVGVAGYQYVDVKEGLDGLVDRAPDNGPRPLSGRTWQEGIQWALQQEDIMQDADWQRMSDLIDERLAAERPSLVKAIWDAAVDKSGTAARAALRKAMGG